jgi:hypothetical protein
MVLAQKEILRVWNRIEAWDTNPHRYALLIFDEVTKDIRWRLNSLFNKCCWEKRLSACRKLALDPCLALCTTIIILLNCIHFNTSHCS